MLESDLVEYLNEILSPFTESLGGVQVDLGKILHGAISFRNVQLKPSIFVEIGLPLNINFNVIKKLSIKLSNGKFFIEIEDLLIISTLLSIDNWDGESYIKCYLARQESVLKYLEEKVKDLLKNGLKDSFFSKIVNRVSNSLIGLLKIRVSNVHIRIEDDYTNSPAVAFGVKVPFLELLPSVDNENLPPIAKKINDIKSITHLHLKFSNVGIYIDPLHINSGGNKPKNNGFNDRTSSKTQSMVTKCIEQLNQTTQLHGFTVQLVDISKYDDIPTISSYLDYLPQFSCDKLLAQKLFASQSTTDVEDNDSKQGIEPNPSSVLNSGDFIDLTILASHNFNSDSGSDTDFTNDNNSDELADESYMDESIEKSQNINESIVENDINQTYRTDKLSTFNQKIVDMINETIDDSKPIARIESEDNFFSYSPAWHTDLKTEKKVVDKKVVKKKVDEWEENVWRLMKDSESEEKLEEFFKKISCESHHYVNDPAHTDLYLDIYISPNPISHRDTSLIKLFKNDSLNDDINTCFAECLIPNTPGLPETIVCIRITNIVLVLSKSELLQLYSFIEFIIWYVNWLFDLETQVVSPNDKSGDVYKQKWIQAIINSNKNECRDVVKEATDWCKNFESKYPVNLINILCYNAAYEALHGEKLAANFELFFKNWLISTFRVSIAVDLLVENACIYFGRKRAFVITAKRLHLYNTSSMDFVHYSTQLEVNKLFVYEKLSRFNHLNPIISVVDDTGGIYFGMDSCLAFTSPDENFLENGKFSRIKGGNGGVINFIAFKNDSPINIYMPNKKSFKLLSFKRSKKLSYPHVKFYNAIELCVVNDSPVSVNIPINNDKTLKFCIENILLDTLALVLKCDILKIFFGDEIVFSTRLPIKHSLERLECGDHALSLDLGKVFIKFTPLQLMQLRGVLQLYTGHKSSSVIINDTESVANIPEDDELVSNTSFNRLKRVRNLKITLDHVLVALEGHVSLSLIGIYLNLFQINSNHSKSSDVSANCSISDVFLSDCEGKNSISCPIAAVSNDVDYRLNEQNCEIIEHNASCQQLKCKSFGANGGICFVEMNDISNEIPIHMKRIYSGGDEVSSFLWLHKKSRFPDKQHISFKFDGENLDLEISPIFVLLHPRIFYLPFITDDTEIFKDTKLSVGGKYKENITPKTAVAPLSININFEIKAIDVYLLLGSSNFFRPQYKNHWKKIKYLFMTRECTNSSDACEFFIHNTLPNNKRGYRTNNLVFPSARSVIDLSRIRGLNHLNEYNWWPNYIIHFSARISISISCKNIIQARLSVFKLYVSLMKNFTKKKLEDAVPNYILFPARFNFNCSLFANAQMITASLTLDPITISICPITLDSLSQFTNVYGTNKTSLHKPKDITSLDFNDNSNEQVDCYTDDVIDKIINETDISLGGKVDARSSMWSFYLSFFVDAPLIELLFSKNEVSLSMTIEQLKACGLFKPKLRSCCAEYNSSLVVDNLPKINLLFYKDLMDSFEQLHNKGDVEFKRMFRYGTLNSLALIELSTIVSVEMICNDFSEMPIEPLQIVSRAFWPKYNSPISFTLATSWLNINIDPRIMPILSNILNKGHCSDHNQGTGNSGVRVYSSDRVPSLQITNQLGCDVLIGDIRLPDSETLPLYTTEGRLPEFTLSLEGFEPIGSANLLPKSVNYMNIIHLGNDMFLMIKMLSMDKSVSTNGMVVISSCLQITGPQLSDDQNSLFLHTAGYIKQSDKVPDGEKIFLDGTISVPFNWTGDDIYLSDGNKSILLITNARFKMMMLKGCDFDESKKSYQFNGLTFRLCYTFSSCEGLGYHSIEIAISNCLVIKNLLCYNLKVSLGQSLKVIYVGKSMGFYSFSNFRLSWDDFTSGDIQFDSDKKKRINFHNGVEEVKLVAHSGYEAPYNYIKGHISCRVVSGYISVKITAYSWVLNWLDYPIFLNSEFNCTVIKSKSICMVTDDIRNSKVTIQMDIGDIKKIDNFDCYPKNMSNFDKFFSNFKTCDVVECSRFVIEPGEFVVSAKATHFHPKLSYTCSIREAPFPFNNTLVLLLTPKYVVHSQIDRPIIISQRNFECTSCMGCDKCGKSDVDLVINPGECIEIHPYQKLQSNFGSFLENFQKAVSRDESLSVRFSLGSGYSPRINISKLARTQITLDMDSTEQSSFEISQYDNCVARESHIVNAIKTIQIQISNLNSSTVSGNGANIHSSNMDWLYNISGGKYIEILPVKVPLWTIVNISKFELLAAQMNIDKWITLHSSEPNSSTSNGTLATGGNTAKCFNRNAVEFSWFDPTGSKKLQLKIGRDSKKCVFNLKNKANGRISEAIIVKASKLKNATTHVFHAKKVKIILSVDMRIVNGRRYAFVDVNITEDNVENKRKRLDLMINECILTFPFNFHAQILGIGLSYGINGSELFYASTTMAKMSILKNLRQRNVWVINASLGWLQIDIHDHSAAFKTLLFPLPDFYRKQTNTHNLLSVMAFEIMFVDPDGDHFLQINRISFYAVPFVINLDAKFIRFLSLHFSQIGELNGPNSPTACAVSNYSNESPRSCGSSVCATSRPKSVERIVYIDNIEFGRLIFIISINGCNGSLSSNIKGLGGSLGSWITGYLFNTMESMIHISEATIEFSPLKLNNISGGFGALLAMIFNRYTYRGIRQFYNVLGAIDLFGNPKSVIRHFLTGIMRCVRNVRTALTVLHLPQVCIPIMLRAASNVVQGVLAGFFNGIYRFTASWQQLLLSLANNWVPHPFTPRKAASSNLLMGFICGLEKLLKCLGESLWNFIFKPSEVFKLTRGRSAGKVAMLVSKSLVSSVNSLVWGAVSTTLVLPSEIAKGILNHLQWVPNVCSIRPKKFTTGLFDFDDSWSASVGRVIGKKVKSVIELEMPIVRSDSAYHTIYWKRLTGEIDKMSKLTFNWSESTHVKKLLWITNDCIGIDYCGKTWQVKGEDVDKISLVEISQGNSDQFDVQVLCPKSTAAALPCNIIHFINVKLKCDGDNIGGQTINLTRFSVKMGSNKKPALNSFIQPCKIKGIPPQLLAALTTCNCAIVKLPNYVNKTNLTKSASNRHAKEIFSIISHASFDAAN